MADKKKSKAEQERADAEWRAENWTKDQQRHRVVGVRDVDHPEIVEKYAGEFEP